MKRIAIVVVIAIIAIYMWPRHAPVETATGPIDHVTTLTPAQRGEVAKRIESAHASHAATPRPSLPPIVDTPPGPRPALDSNDPVVLKQTLRDAMHEVISHIAGCYESSFSYRGHTALYLVARLTLTGDPDVGTLIDVPQLYDRDGAPLPPQLDDCLRDTLQSLELPPLAEGDNVVVDWPFTFRSAGD